MASITHRNLTKN